MRASVYVNHAWRSGRTVVNMDAARLVRGEVFQHRVERQLGVGDGDGHRAVWVVDMFVADAEWHDLCRLGGGQGRARKGVSLREEEGEDTLAKHFAVASEAASLRCS